MVIYNSRAFVSNKIPFNALCFETFSPECKPELYVSFDGDTRDHSGKHVYVRNVGVIVDRNAGRNGAGFFDGNSYLSIPRFSNIDVESYLKIQFIYKETNDSHLPMALITNADCGSQGTIGVGQDFHTVFFGLRDSVGDLVKTSVEKKVRMFDSLQLIYLTNANNNDSNCRTCGILADQWVILKNTVR